MATGLYAKKDKNAYHSHGCNGYHHRKQTQTQQPEFKSWMKCWIFHKALVPSRKFNLGMATNLGEGKLCLKK